MWLETALSKLPEQNKASATRVVAITRDVTTHKIMHDQLDQLASTDDLTKLANRRSFNVRFEEAMKRARRGRTPLSLLMIDADRFKLLNDIYGHAAGDECLAQIAAVVRNCVKRPGDIAARYGGEEMAVLLSDADIGGRGQWLKEFACRSVRWPCRIRAIRRSATSPSVSERPRCHRRRRATSLLRPCSRRPTRRFIGRRKRGATRSSTPTGRGTRSRSRPHDRYFLQARCSWRICRGFAACIVCIGHALQLYRMATNVPIRCFDAMEAFTE